jgi:hypothetical protein
MNHFPSPAYRRVQMQPNDLNLGQRTALLLVHEWGSHSGFSSSRGPWTLAGAMLREKDSWRVECDYITADPEDKVLLLSHV